MVTDERLTDITGVLKKTIASNRGSSKVTDGNYQRNSREFQDKMMKIPRVLLYGIGGTYNYGCEAIVRGTEILVREIWHDAKVFYASVRPDDDKQRLKGCNLRIMPRFIHRKYSIKNITRKALSYVDFPWLPLREDAYILDGCDIVLSIGGDLYTCNPKGGYSHNLVQFGEYIMRSGKKLVIWGASIGPFEENPRAKRIMARHLRRADLITVREPVTKEYLASLGIESNVILCADPAFVIETEESPKKTEKCDLCVGVNLSPISASYLAKGKGYSDFTQKYSKAIMGIIDETDCRVKLLPHVFSNVQKVDDDLSYLKAILSNIPKHSRDRVELIKNDIGFFGLRKEISKCDFVVASRMHCAINALGANVPVIFVSYSQKAKGMAEYIYGDRSWVIDIEDFCRENLCKRVRAMIDDIENIKSKVKRRLKDVREEARFGARALKMLQ